MLIACILGNVYLLMRAHHVFNHVYSGKHVVINARTSCVSRVYSGKRVFINARTLSVDRVYSGKHVLINARTSRV